MKGISVTDALSYIKSAQVLLEKAAAELEPTVPTVPIVPALSAYSKIKWSQDYTKMTTLDPAVYNLCDGWTDQQGVTTRAANLKLDPNAGLIIVHPQQGESGKLFTIEPVFGVDEVIEAELWVPGNGQGLAFNWATAWTGQASNWPADGEYDYYEVQNGGKATVNYHSPAGADNDPTGGQTGWVNQWIKATCLRGTGPVIRSAAWWTKTGMAPVVARAPFAPSDSEQPETVVFSDGEQPGSLPNYDPTGQVAFKIRNVTIYQKP